MDKDFLNIIKNFDTTGQLFIAVSRNSIKLFDFNGKSINVKSFKKPDFFQGIIYRFFRKSKAKRSFEYAKILESKDIGTPKPIAYYENNSGLTLKESFYISEHLQPDFIFRDLFLKEFLDLENILRQFAHFCFKLHENGIEFKDHSPGNTLIKEVEKGKYEFYLVDLNRMKFHKEMDFKTRMKNLNRITPSEGMIRVISYEYAKLYGKSNEDVFYLMWKYASKFYSKSDKKRKLKEKFNL